MYMSILKLAFINYSRYLAFINSEETTVELADENDGPRHNYIIQIDLKTLTLYQVS